MVFVFLFQGQNCLPYDDFQPGPERSYSDIKVLKDESVIQRQKSMCCSYLCRYLLLALSFLPLSVPAGVVAVVTPESQASIINEGEGVELLFDKEGKLLSIKSTFTQAVTSADRRDIAKAYVIAEEKAKANIARFLNQSISSSRIVSELDESARVLKGNGDYGGGVWSKDSSRRVSQSFNEILTSNSSAILRGVQVLSRLYSEKDEEVRVVVGIRKEAEGVARRIQRNFD